MVRKAGRERPPILSAGPAERVAGEGGFTLIEVVCVLAIIALLAAILLPEIPRGTSRSRLEAYALEIATVLKSDRNAAIRHRAAVATEIDAIGRSVRSGASARIIRVPADVQFDAALGQPLQSARGRLHDRLFRLRHVVRRRDCAHAARRRLSNSRQLAHGRR